MWGDFMLERSAKKYIDSWIQSGRDALLITGARQIGKTYLIKECLRESGVPYVELNFIDQPELVKLFDGARDAKDLLMRLSLVTKQPLEKDRTIIFLDEVQEFKDMVTRVKFLVEDGSYRYIMSGSLLGVELNDLRSAPVGYLRVCDMYPMDLHEFMVSVGVNQNVIDTLKECFTQRLPVDSFVHEKMLDVFNLYLIVGGMPEAVNTYVETNDLAKVAEVHEKIVRLYKSDFTKYETRYKLKLQEIYDAMPGQLDRKNKRFQINSIGKGLSYDRVANDFLWLKDAGVAIPVYNISEPKLPLVISENRNLFKLFFSDVGLLTSRYSDRVKMAILNKEKSINNGALFENVVSQELLSKGHKEYYFNSKKQGELDFVIELNGKVVPLEIKSGKDYKRHSALCNVLADENYGIEYDIVHHQGEQRLVGVPFGLEEGGQEAPYGAGQQRSRQRDDDQQEIGDLAAQQDHAGGGGQTADQGLTLGADVPEPHFERRRHRQRDTQQHGYVLAGDPDLAGGAEGTLEDRAVDGDGILTGQQGGDQSAEHQCQQQDTAADQQCLGQRQRIALGDMKERTFFIHLPCLLPRGSSARPLPACWSCGRPPRRRPDRRTVPRCGRTAPAARPGPRLHTRRRRPSSSARSAGCKWCKMY